MTCILLPEWMVYALGVGCTLNGIFMRMAVEWALRRWRQ
jgi:hypothetical protein